MTLVSTASKASKTSYEQRQRESIASKPSRASKGMTPYYQDSLPTIYCSDCLEGMRQLEADSVDLLCTDPPYGLSFMGKNWDKAVPSVEIWKECLRMLKPGAFAFVMCIPRQDCLSRMIVNLSDAGFETGFTSIYWAYASGFPKAQNIGKKIDTRLGLEGKVIGSKKVVDVQSHKAVGDLYQQVNKLPMKDELIRERVSPKAKALDGSYAGFQPKPAVEVILVCMKPLSEKTYVDQALSNQKGITWLDDGKIPIPADDRHEYGVDGDEQSHTGETGIYGDFGRVGYEQDNRGRFPANLLASDDVLDDGRVRHKAGNIKPQIRDKKDKTYNGGWKEREEFSDYYQDSGSFSRYFSLDKWAQKTFPFLIVPKASRAEKNRGLEQTGTGHVVQMTDKGGAWLCECGRKYMMTLKQCPKCGSFNRELYHVGSRPVANNHPTCKPIKLMSYLITLGSREGDTVLDPFLGSGTTCVAAKMLNRKSIGFEDSENDCEISAKRCQATIPQMVMELNFD